MSETVAVTVQYGNRLVSIQVPVDIEAIKFKRRLAVVFKLFVHQQKLYCRQQLVGDTGLLTKYAGAFKGVAFKLMSITDPVPLVKSGTVRVLSNARGTFIASFLVTYMVLN
jgi:hypothetical protein